MNFFEAYKKAKNDGIKVTISSSSTMQPTWYLSIVEGKIKMCGNDNIEINPTQPWKWYLDSWLNSDEINWQIYKEPKEKPGPMGLWHSERDPDGVEDLYTKHYVSCRNYVIESQQRAWSDALGTFMRLKGHPLAKKANDDGSQFFIRPTQEKLKIESYECLFNKLTEVSATFDSTEDADQAIKDIGKDNLLHMFKTFSGLYE